MADETPGAQLHNDAPGSETPAAPPAPAVPETPAAKPGEEPGGKKEGDEPAPKKEEKPAEVPEKYALKLPDGVLVDDAVMGEFTDWAKANKLTNAEAQKAADLHMKSIGVFAAKQAAELQKQQSDWAEEVKNDKEFGGAKADETVAAARKVLDAFGTAEEVKRLKADLVRTGMDNHPILVKGLRLFAEFVGDDKVIIGSARPAGAKDPVSVLYGNQTK